MTARRQDFGRPDMDRHHRRLGPAPETRVVEVLGATTEFSRRSAPAVETTPVDHLMCVNFHRVPQAEYVYAGGRPARGVRHVGSSHLVPAGHEIRGRTPGPTDHVVLRIRPRWLEDLAGRTFDTSDVELRTDGLPFFDPTLFHLATMLREELVTGRPGGDLAVESLLTLVGVRLLRVRSDVAAEPPGTGGLGPRALNRVRDHVEAHLGESLTVADLAAVAGLSEYHFLRSFRSPTGRTPRQYVLDRRVARVRDRLHEDVSLADLSAEAGFSSQSHMTRAFRLRVGTTPNALRRVAERAP